MTLGIRKLDAGDLSALLTLYRQLNQADHVLPQDKAETRFNEMLEHPGLVAFGGFFEDTLVASCILHVMPDLTRGAASYALIENVVTDERHRHKGFGQAVLRAAIDAALGQGCYKVMLLTGRTDPGVQRFYESCGFSQSKVGFEIRAE